MRTHSIHVPHSKLESGAGTVSWNEDEVVISHGSLSQPGKDKQNYKFLVGKIKSLHGCRLMASQVKDLCGILLFQDWVIFAFGSHKKKWPWNHLFFRFG